MGQDLLDILHMKTKKKSSISEYTTTALVVHWLTYSQRRCINSKTNPKGTGNFFLQKEGIAVDQRCRHYWGIHAAVLCVQKVVTHFIY